jgi:hypothetical protein
MKENTYVKKVLLSNYVLLRDEFADTHTARIYQCTKNDNLYMLEVTSVKDLLEGDSSDNKDIDFALDYATLLLEHEGIYHLDRDPKVRYVYTTGKGIEFYTVRYTAVKKVPVTENCYQ